VISTGSLRGVHRAAFRLEPPRRLSLGPGDCLGGRHFGEPTMAQPPWHRRRDLGPSCSLDVRHRRLGLSYALAAFISARALALVVGGALASARATASAACRSRAATLREAGQLSLRPRNSGSAISGTKLGSSNETGTLPAALGWQSLAGGDVGVPRATRT